ncbi:MAG: amidophosphoribosyltransferase [Verrucomicrobiae bacterium]|nr:amidophosphoribosyltransferase [Verrucomicrobiae bacterium]
MLSSGVNQAEAKPKHYCGVFGIYGHPNAAELTYYGLYALQHRGQESAGIVTATADGEPFQIHRGMGLVSQVFNEENLAQLKGTRSIGHVRYSTTGSSMLKNAQPLVVDCARGQVAIAHNGNIVNANVLRDELEAYGSIFQTTVDSEIILHLMAQPKYGDRDNNLLQALRRIQGAYSLVILGEIEMIGVRDPHGFRPLSIGRIGDAYVLSSETCAFDLIHAQYVRDVEPGEVVTIDKNGLRSYKIDPDHQQQSLCVFEYVYFARPDSMLGGRNVSFARIEMGRQLAREYPAEADVVIPVPDSGNYCTLGYAEQLAIPFRQAFVRNHYIGRTFLQPTQLIRDFNVRVKLNLIKDEVRGKRVVVVDDSIVRGTTARARVTSLREAGAKEVHVRVSCPPHRFSCHYGIDFPTRKELLANQHSLDEIRRYLGADSIGYLSLDGMIRAAGKPASTFCTACYTGDYPVPFDRELDKFIMEKRKTRGETFSDALQKEASEPKLL